MVSSENLTIEDITAASKKVFENLSQDLPDEIRNRLKPQRIAQRHGTEIRMFQFYFYDKHQPQLLDFHHFGYTLIYDPFLRYHEKQCIARFYINRHRIYDKRAEVVSLMWNAMKEAEQNLFDFKALENEQMIGLFRMFDAKNHAELEERAYQAFLELIPYWHSKYAAIVDCYGASLTQEQVAQVIAGRQKFQPSVPRSPIAQQKYSRHVPSRLREKVFKRDGRKCLKCGDNQNLHADHIIPVANGGITTLENLQTLCGLDNALKGSRDQIDYRKSC